MARTLARRTDRVIDQIAVQTPRSLLKSVTVGAVLLVLGTGVGVGLLIGAVPRASDIGKGVGIGGAVVLILCGLAFGFMAVLCFLARQRRMRWSSGVGVRRKPVPTLTPPQTRRPNRGDRHSRVLRAGIAPCPKLLGKGECIEGVFERQSGLHPEHKGTRLALRLERHVRAFGAAHLRGGQRMGNTMPGNSHKLGPVRDRELAALSQIARTASNNRNRSVVLVMKGPRFESGRRLRFIAANLCRPAESSVAPLGDAFAWP
jgi:hypothetical protein